MNIRQFIKDKYFEILIFLFVIIQITLIIFLKTSQTSDAAVYIGLANEAIKNHGIYPSNINIYSNYICAPGYINYLIIFLKVFKQSIKAILLGNVLLNIILLFETYYIANNFFNKRTAKIAVIIFCLYISNYGASLYSLTEQLYCIFAYGSLCLFLKSDKRLCFLSGIFIILANWIRPLAIPFIIAIILINIIKKNRISNLCSYFLGILLAVLMIGSITYQSSGYFEFQAVSGGRNLIMGANDLADGSYKPDVFDKGNLGYIKNIDNMTYKQRDKYWIDKSLNWIKNNPTKYIKLFPKKLFYMYALDTHFLSPLSGKGEFYKIDRTFISSMFKLSSYKMALNNDKNKFLLYIIVLLNQVYYGLIIIASVIGIIKLIKKKEFIVYVFLAIILLGTANTIITVGGSRYHYPYVITFIILAAYGLEYIIKIYKDKKFINIDKEELAS